MGPERDPCQAQGLDTEALVPNPGFCQEACSCSPPHRFTAGECLLRTPRTGGRGWLHGEGGSSSGGPGSQPSRSLGA